MKQLVRLLAHKTFHYVILEDFLKDKPMKEVVSEINIISNSSTKEIIRQNKFQMRFLDKFLLGEILIKDYYICNYMFNVGVSIHFL